MADVHWSAVTSSVPSVALSFVGQVHYSLGVPLGVPQVMITLYLI